MSRIFAAICLALVAPVAWAQQPVESDLFRRAIAPLQTQRNMAMDDNVNLRVQLDKLTEDLIAAKLRIKELEEKLPKEEPKKE